MASRPYHGGIERLAGWISAPYRQDEVLKAARELQPPFLLREIVDATGLPRPVVHRCLGRLVKKGQLTRSKARIICPPIKVAKPVWIYMPVEAE